MSAPSSLYKVGDHIRFGTGVKHHAIVVDDPHDDFIIEVVDYGAFAATDGVKKGIIGSLLGTSDQGMVRRTRIDVGLHGCDIVPYDNDAGGDPTSQGAGENAEESKTSYQTREPDQVRNAAYFMVDNGHLLPPYHVTFCNCECVARWIKTGSFSSGQAKGFYKVGRRASDAVAPSLKQVAVLANIVSSIGAAADQRRAHVENLWSETEQVLDDGFMAYLEDPNVKNKTAK